MIKIKCEVAILEMDGKEQKGSKIFVMNHWNLSDGVVLQIDDGKTVTVSRRDLEAAIENATNVNWWL